MKNLSFQDPVLNFTRTDVFGMWFPRQNTRRDLRERGLSFNQNVFICSIFIFLKKLMNTTWRKTERRELENRHVEGEKVEREEERNLWEKKTKENQRKKKGRRREPTVQYCFQRVPVMFCSCSSPYDFCLWYSFIAINFCKTLNIAFLSKYSSLSKDKMA